MSQLSEAHQLLQTLKSEFANCTTSSFKRRGFNRVLDAERFLTKDFGYAKKLIEEAIYELEYAKEHTEIQKLRAF